MSKWKTVSIYSEIYVSLCKKRDELIEKNNGEYVDLGWVASQAVLVGIDNVRLEIK